jgi:putative transposase
LNGDFSIWLTGSTGTVATAIQGTTAMSLYRRYYVEGATYFFTVVTHERRPILTMPVARTSLRAAIQTVRRKRPFDVIAMVLMPDHIHAVWALPRGDADYSFRWAQIKEIFTRRYLAVGGEEGSQSASRARHRERAVWQRRFWEHTVRDEDDLQRCVEYIHWNPVKHGLAEHVLDYPWSTFHRYVRLGEYDRAWGMVNPCPEADKWGWE